MGETALVQTGQQSVFSYVIMPTVVMQPVEHVGVWVLVNKQAEYLGCVFSRA